MEDFANKYREQIKIFGYTTTGLGFCGMVFICYYIIHTVILATTVPAMRESVSLVLPFTNIPGVGYLSFWYFLISIFIIMVIHEFAHGIVSKAYGLKVNSSGLAVFGLIAPILPGAFVEPDEKGMKKEKDIVQYSIFSAGPGINILFALLLAILFLMLPATAGINIENSITQPIGVSIDLINESYPAAQAGLYDGAIITAVNGKETLDWSKFSILLAQTKPGETVIITANNTDYTLTTTTNPNYEDVAFIGVTSPQNERRLLEEYETFGKIFFWFKGLLRWLITLSFAVGIFNLLPIMIVDGGRMLEVVLEQTIKSKEKAKKIWVYVGSFFGFIMLYLLALRYAPSLFKFVYGLVQKLFNLG